MRSIGDTIYSHRARLQVTAMGQSFTVYRKKSTGLAQWERENETEEQLVYKAAKRSK